MRYSRRKVPTTQQQTFHTPDLLFEFLDLVSLLLFSFFVSFSRAIPANERASSVHCCAPVDFSTSVVGIARVGEVVNGCR